MSEQLTKSLKLEARKLGFQLSGACPAVTPEGYSSFLDWLDSGFHGEMNYLDQRREAYSHPKFVLEGCKSVLMLGMSYHRGVKQKKQPGTGLVAKYAWGSVDYHDVIHTQLKKLLKVIQEKHSEITARGVVDTAPLLEREFAQLAGLGWQAKNTMLINREFGSWFFIAAILLDVELEFDEPFSKNHCGTCTACLEACPTDAFVEPGKMDARRCISYLTIELRNPIPVELRNGIGDWLFGCDICQDVCPWNRKAQSTELDSFEPLDWQNPNRAAELFDLDDDSFRERFRKTPLWRTKRRGLLRNAAIVLGNSGEPSVFEALAKGIRDEEALVRGASAWALGKLNTPMSRALLADRLGAETEEEVRREIQMALSEN